MAIQSGVSRRQPLAFISDDDDNNKDDDDRSVNTF